MTEPYADIAIAGGGPVGLALAAALKQALPDLAVLLVDERAGPAPPDGRAFAIGPGSRRLLEGLGVWATLAPQAQPIDEMIVTDSRVEDVARPVFLAFAAAEGEGAPYAHMVPSALLANALAAAAVAAGVAIAAPDAIDGFAAEDDAVTLRRRGGARVRAALLVAADGVRSRLRTLAGIRTLTHDYRQTGLVATIAHERPHHGRAEEHFLPPGPFAFLPLTGNRASLVWVETPAVAEHLLAADTATFNAALTQRLGHHLGAVAVAGPRHAHPLILRIARDFVRPRFALVGDAAHSIHPLAGQGLNLGLRDVAALAQTLVEARRLGLDIGALDVLERYQAWRRFDTMEMAALADGLNRLFATDNPLIRAARDIGLGLVDRMPAVKEFLAGRAAGAGADIPRLLKGEPI